MLLLPNVWKREEKKQFFFFCFVVCHRFRNKAGYHIVCLMFWRVAHPFIFFDLFYFLLSFLSLALKYNMFQSFNVTTSFTVENTWADDTLSWILFRLFLYYFFFLHFSVLSLFRSNFVCPVNIIKSFLYHVQPSARVHVCVRLYK